MFRAKKSTASDVVLVGRDRRMNENSLHISVIDRCER